LFISAKKSEGIQALKNYLSEQVKKGLVIPSDVLVTNVRHYNALQNALSGIVAVEEGLRTGLTTDLLATDVRDALDKLGEITGEITTDDLLDHIFKNFCIGK
jgi:tRNA modification GTPase